MIKSYFIWTIILLIISCQSVLSQNNDTKEYSIDSIFVEPEKYPYFPGGDIELRRFIGQNIDTKVVGDTSLIDGKVIVSFIIDTLGIVGDFKVIKSYNKTIDAEFLRVLKLMPKWEPGELCMNNMKGPWIKVPNKYYIPLKIPFHGYKN